MSKINKEYCKKEYSLNIIKKKFQMYFESFFFSAKDFFFSNI